jgi:enoyl-CoA hydratase/carnithine racemase
LPRRIGRWRTAYLALADHFLDVDEALRWGLIDAVAEGAAL